MIRERGGDIEDRARFIVWLKVIEAGPPVGTDSVANEKTCKRDETTRRKDAACACMHAECTEYKELYKWFV